MFWIFSWILIGPNSAVFSNLLPSDTMHWSQISVYAQTQIYYHIFGSFLGFWLAQTQLCVQISNISQCIGPQTSQMNVSTYSLHVSEFVRSSGVGNCSGCVGLAGLVSGQGRGCVHRMFCWSQTLVPPIFFSMVPPHETDRLLWLQQIPEIPCPLWDSSTRRDAQHFLCYAVIGDRCTVEAEEWDQSIHFD